MVKNSNIYRFCLTNVVENVFYTSTYHVTKLGKTECEVNNFWVFCKKVSVIPVKNLVFSELGVITNILLFGLKKQGLNKYHFLRIDGKFSISHVYSILQKVPCLTKMFEFSHLKAPWLDVTTTHAILMKLDIQFPRINVVLLVNKPYVNEVTLTASNSRAL